MKFYNPITSRVKMSEKKKKPKGDEPKFDEVMRDAVAIKSA